MRPSAPLSPEADEAFGKALEDVQGILKTVVFGLAKQGHIPTIQSMLEQGKTWTEIGQEIGWEPKTAREHYERHCHEAGTWQHDVLPVLAAAVGMLEKFAKQPETQAWDRNDVASIVLRANKLLSSTPEGPQKYEY